MEHPVDGTQMSKASMIKGMLNGANRPMQQAQHSGLTIGTGLPIGAPVKTVGDVLALIQKYVGGGGGGGGEQGPSGPQGLQGPQGETGSMGPTGPAGPIGPEGISAYEVALIEGFVGTEAEWLASLVGPEGPAGPQGATGPAGADGADGATTLDELTDVDLTTPPTDGQVLVYDAVSGTWMAGDQTGGGGGGSGVSTSDFTGATISALPTAGSTSAFATKGTVFTTTKACTVRSVAAFIGGSATPLDSLYEFQIASLSSLTVDPTDPLYATSLTVGTVLGTTGTVVTGTTEVKYLKADFVTPVELAANTDYVIVSILTGGTGVSANRTTIPDRVGGHIMQAPGITYRGAFLFNTIGLSPAQTESSSGNGTYTLMLEGTTVSGGTTVPVDLPLYIEGSPTSEQLVYRSVMARELTLPADMAGTVGHVGVLPTVSPGTLSIQRNGSIVGQVNVDTAGVFSFTTQLNQEQVFAVGDRFEVVGAVTPNATMADISLTFVFTRDV